MLYLHAPQKRKDGISWCGPTALTIITGLSYEEVHAKLVEGARRCLRRPIIKGTTVAQLDNALKGTGLSLGPKLRNWEYPYDGTRGWGPTFKKWLANRGPATYNAVCLVGVGDHWAVVQAGEVGDSEQGLVLIEESKHLRKRVDGWYVVNTAGPPVQATVLRVTLSPGVTELLLRNTENGVEVVKRTKSKLVVEGTGKALGKLRDRLLRAAEPASGLHCSQIWSAQRAAARIKEVTG